MKEPGSSSAIHESVRIHETAIIEAGVSIGKGSSVWDNAHIRKNAHIGENCIIGDKSYIAYDVIIGNGVKINSFVYIPAYVTVDDNVMISAGTIFTNDMFPRAFDPDTMSPATSDPTEETLYTYVRQGVTIGAGAVIGPGITLGEYSMIGMGAVVTHDVAPYQLVYGNPARPRGYVCKCGKPLAESAGDREDQSLLTCSACQRRYVLSEGKVSSRD